MSEKIKVIKEITISYSGIFDVREIYKIIKKWCKENGYLLMEREYTEAKKDLRNTSIKFEAEKKVSPYVKLIPKIKIKIGDYEDVEYKNKTLSKGKVDISFEGETEIDYEDMYQNKPLLRFFRGIFDLFIAGDKMGKIKDDFKSDINSLHDEVKEFLNLYKFK